MGAEPSKPEEPQPEELSESYEEVKAKLLQTGRLFEDEDFPATELSVFYKKDRNRKPFEWKRPFEISDNPQFVVEGMSKYDLNQGEVGNCWFISAASVLTTKKELFDRVVVSNQSFKKGDYAGIFRFYFWRFGEWKEVIIDDRLPTRWGQLIFCSNQDQKNEFWSALLEKAYAKLHGSYQAIEGGFPQDALVDMTGGIGEAYYIQDFVRNPEFLYHAVMRSFKMNSLLCCGTGAEGEGREVHLTTGLVSTHAYSINNVVQLEKDGETVKLIRLLNPWGQKEWNGAWSDGSPEWKTITEEQRDKLNLTTANEGEFWMSFEDFMKNFSNLNICHLAPGSMVLSGRTREWNMVSHNGQWIEGVSAGGCGNPPYQAKYWTNPQYFVKLTDPDDGDNVHTCSIVVSLMQKNRRRMRTEMKTLNYLDVAIGFKVFKYRGDDPEELDGESVQPSELRRLDAGTDVFKRQRETTGRFDLAPGTYCIIPSVFQPDIEADFLLRVATEKPVEFGEVVSTSKPLVTVSGGSKNKKFFRLFKRFSGDDNVVDFKELQKILNKGLTSEDDEGLSKETCRSLVHMYSFESKGLLTEEECKLVWKRIFDMQSIFEDFDTDDSGLLSRAELNNALKKSGVGLSRKCLAAVITRFYGKEGGLGFDDFVLISLKTQHLYKRLQKLAEREGIDTVSGPTFDEWMEALV